MIFAAGEVDRGRRLDLFLQSRLPDYSRSRLQSWIRSGAVMVDGGQAKASLLLKGGESISVSPEPLPPLAAAAEDLPLRVLYEDEDLVVVEKDAGVVVHAGAGHHRGTLVNALLHRFGQLSTAGGPLRPGLVHRLDRGTSGVLVVARTDHAHRHLAAQFQARTVEKIYLALVHGALKRPAGRITAPIARDPVHRTRMTTRVTAGRPAVTDYRLLEYWPGFSFLELRLGTGRTHQIRVHLASLHHPVVGDTTYGAPRHLPGMAPLGRLFLHAHRLGFDSPSTGQRIVITSPLPAGLEQFAATLRAAKAPPETGRIGPSPP